MVEVEGRGITNIIENHLSPTKIINVGVPQGSILGPLLFLLYINDLPMYINNNNMVLYADDTSLAMSHKDPKMLQLELESSLLLLDK
jgi:sarcosine oxidase/L-pipecolate oxidase